MGAPTSTRPVLRRLLIWTLALGPLVLVALAIRSRWDDVGGVSGLPGVWPVVASVALNVAGNVTLAMAWRRQVALAGVSAPGRWPTLAVWSSSQLSRMLFPGAPVGARAVLAHEHGVRRAVGAWTTLLELVWTLSISPFVVLATLPAWAAYAEGWRVFGIAAVVPAGVLLWVVARPVRALGWVARVLRRLPVLRRMVPDDIESVAVDLGPRDAAGLFGRYLANYVIRMLAFLVLLAGMADLTTSLLVTAIGANALGRFVGTIALFAPGGIGPREGVIALVLAPLLGSGVLVLVAVARLSELVAEAIVLVVARLGVRSPSRQEAS